MTVRDAEKNWMTVGSFVHYFPSHKPYEVGIISSIQKGRVRVVYQCDGDWMNFHKYGGQRTTNTDLVARWPPQAFRLNGLSEEFANYNGLRIVPHVGLCGIRPMIFTHGLFYGLDSSGAMGRYCFKDSVDAEASLLMWNGEESPGTAWIKHSKTLGGEERNPNFEQ